AAIVGAADDRSTNEFGQDSVGVECIGADGLQLAARVCSRTLGQSEDQERAGAPTGSDENAEAEAGGMDRSRTGSLWLCLWVLDEYAYPRFDRSEVQGALQSVLCM